MFVFLYRYRCVSIAQALRDTGRGSLSIHHFWSDFPYNAADFLRGYNNLCDFGLIDYVSFHHTNFYEWLKDPSHFNILHLDISNDGTTILKAAFSLIKPISYGASVLFEGGSIERDGVQWMEDHGCPKIGNTPHHGVGYEILNNNFPSISYMNKDTICF